MLLVDIFVPSVDMMYNFSLNETVEIEVLIQEIVEMICQKEKTKYAGNPDRLHLYNRENGERLSKNAVLEDCGISTGARLILV